MLAPPESYAPAFRVSVLARDSFAAFPPSLGDTGVLPKEAIYDTLFVLPQRLGMEPRPAADWRTFVSAEDEAKMVVNLRRAPEEDDLAELVQYARKGGQVIILDDEAARSADRASMRILSAAGVAIEGVCADHVHYRGLAPLREGGGKLGMLHRRVGRGGITYVFPSTLLTRGELGHCMAVPTTGQRQVLGECYELFREISSWRGRRILWRVLE